MNHELNIMVYENRIPVKLAGKAVKASLEEK